MNSNIRYPNITGFTEKEQLAQIKSYLRQLVDNLNYELQNAQTQSAQKIEQTTVVSKGKQTPVSEILQMSMPVGYIYISTAATNPSTLFGFGTWERLKDTFLLAAGDTYAAGTTGGEAKHTLTLNEIPSHSHGLYSRAVYSGGGSYVAHCNQANAGDYDYVTKTRGGGAAHNNMPPYTTVYVWKRTA